MPDIRLVGGAFDGLEGEVRQESIDLGFIVVQSCDTHGQQSWCECNEAMIYGYYSEPGQGAGYFELLEKP